MTLYQDSAKLDKPLTNRAFLLGCAFLKNGGIGNFSDDFLFLKGVLVDDRGADYHRHLEVMREEDGD